MLINSLHKFLKTYDKKVKKRDNEELRRQRLQYVGISTSNIIADFSKTVPDEVSAKTAGKREASKGKDESDDRSSDEEESEGDEPLYTLRVRRQANVSYTLKEYDEMMNSAIQVSSNRLPSSFICYLQISSKYLLFLFRERPTKKIPKKFRNSYLPPMKPNLSKKQLQINPKLKNPKK